jgi:hypothetical protein
LFADVAAHSSGEASAFDYLYADVVPTHFSCEARAFDYSKTGKMALCFAIVEVGKDDNKSFNIAGANYFYANYTIECDE